jgi:hypothetical protein
MDSDSAAVIAEAEALLARGEHDARWEGAAMLEGFAATQPEVIWPLVVRFGSSQDSDLRAAIACCVLEHILEHNFERYFAESERLIVAGNLHFADTFSLCYAFGQAELPENKKRFDALVEQIEAKWA